jgi:hypothetical protein
MSFFNLNNSTIAKINFDLTEFDEASYIHTSYITSQKSKAWYTFNQKLCFNFQSGTLRIINVHKLLLLTARMFLESTIYQ